jgi:hypothetical protein
MMVVVVIKVRGGEVVGVLGYGQCDGEEWLGQDNLRRLYVAIRLSNQCSLSIRLRAHP